MSEVETSFRKKAGDRADELVKEVKESPDWFVMEGGADGTWGHALFWGEFGHLMPEISKLAVEFGGKV